VEIQNSLVVPTLSGQERKLSPSETEDVVGKESKFANARVESFPNKGDNFVKEAVDTADNENVGSGLELDDAVKKVESFLNSQNRDLSFTFDNETKRTIVTVKESSSGEVIRQIPSEEVLKLASRIQELQEDVVNSVGVFINSEI
jgi:flagellar protein FlaG